jgi:hypothetical protein
VHVDKRIGIEHARGRLDAVIEAFRFFQVVFLNRAKQLRL